MKVNIEALKSLAENKGWSLSEFSRRLGVDYTYLSRLVKNERNGYSKALGSVYKICKQENLNFEDYILLDD